MSQTPTKNTRSGARIRLEHVTKAYTLGDGSTLTAADDVTLDIPAGAFTCFTGPSGSGKSTLLHLIGAVDVPDAGTISVDDRTITAMNRRDLADYRASIGFVFQQFHLIPSLNLLDNVLAPLVERKTTYDRHDHARQLLNAVGLGNRTTAMPSQLSGGQQQRVAIARALVGRPNLLLADEPTGNLDSTTATEILDLLRSLQHDHGATLVMATHDPTIAATADHQVTIHDGRPTPASASSPR